MKHFLEKYACNRNLTFLVILHIAFISSYLEFISSYLQNIVALIIKYNIRIRKFFSCNFITMIWYNKFKAMLAYLADERILVKRVFGFRHVLFKLNIKYLTPAYFIYCSFFYILIWLYLFHFVYIEKYGFLKVYYNFSHSMLKMAALSNSRVNVIVPKLKWQCPDKIYRRTDWTLL